MFGMNVVVVVHTTCCNLNLGLVKACKGAGQKGSPRVISHAPGSVGECEGMNLHIHSLHIPK
jgi:hypothetical protein